MSILEFAISMLKEERLRLIGCISYVVHVEVL